MHSKRVQAVSITAELVATVAIYGAAGVSLAYGVELMLVQATVKSISKSRLEKGDTLPTFNRVGGRLSVLVLAWWVWTAAHADVGDRTLSRAVMFARVLCVATICAWTGLWLAPRDFAERFAAWAAKT
jgi:hypothetical protein